MSCSDFERCTPSEFSAVWEAWRRRYEESEHGAWERVRMQCLYSVAPFSDKKLTARDIMQFPWDDEGRRMRNEKSAEETAADKAHFEEVKKARGLR